MFNFFSLFICICYLNGLFTVSIGYDQKKTVLCLGELGSIKTLLLNSAVSNRKYYSFRDIRYAEAPIGIIKFKPSTITRKFTREYYDATEYHQPCPNMYLEISETSENESEILDCLRLSIHSPDTQANNPVIVYLTGFDLVQGSNAEADPGYFMEHDIVFVSVQYRLGVFGFLNANHSDIPGNAAISDILLALQWIQSHISRFGGDPGSVTLMGQYKVAGIIQLLTMIPQADGLFHRILCQSGSIFTENLLILTTSTISAQIGMMLGCPNIFNSKLLSDCILKANIGDLTYMFEKSLRARNGNMGFLTVEGYDLFIPYMPYELRERMKIRPYPMIMGIVENPSTYLMDVNFPENISIFSTNRTNLIDGLGFEKKEYESFLLERIEKEDTKMRKNLITAINFSDLSPDRYVYLFRYSSGKHYLDRKADNPLHDVTLLDDNLFLFPTNRFALNESDKLVSKQLVELWVNFARNGTPSCQEIDTWPKFEEDQGHFLIISRNLKIGKNFHDYRSPLFK